MKQVDMLKQLSNEQLRQQVLLSQLIFMVLSLFFSIFLFDHVTDWFHLFHWDWTAIIYYGFLPALFLVCFEIIVSRWIHPRHLDDGGINERVFKDAKVSTIFLIAIVVAIAEESLFRGIIQTSFGYVFASSLFVLVHFRYLKKPLLLSLLIITSFFIGYLYVLTENLLVTIMFHFTVDFLLGLFIKFRR